MEGLSRRELLGGGGALGFRQRKIIAAAGVAVQEKPPPSLSSSSLAKDKNAAGRKQPPIDGPVAKQQQLKPKREGFALLEEFYEAMESSIALLRIRSQPCTFTAVSSAVESLTKRRFLRSHLAKIKHLFPEAVECDSFTWKDLDTTLLKTDLRIRLKPFTPAGARVTKTASGIGRKFSADTTARRQEFRKRVACFEANFPEDDIPEAPLEEYEEPDELLDPSGSLHSSVLQGVTIKTGYQDMLSRRAQKAEDDMYEYVDPSHSVLSGKVVIKTGYQDIVERRLRSDDEVHMSHFPVGFRPFFSKQQRSRASYSPPSEAAVALTVEAALGEALETAGTPKQATQPKAFATPRSVAPAVARHMKAPESTPAAEFPVATPYVATPRQDTPLEPARVMATPELVTPQQSFSDRGTGGFVTPFSSSVEKQRQVPTFATPKTASGSDTKVAGVHSKRSVVKSLQFGKQPLDEAACSRPDNKLDFEMARTGGCEVSSPSEQRVRIAGSPSKLIAGSPPKPIARSPSKMIAQSPSKMVAQSPSKKFTGSPSKMSPLKQQASITGSPSKMSPLKQQASITGSPSKRLLSPVASPSKRMLLDSPCKRSLLQSPGTPAKQAAREASLDGAGQQILKSLPEELVQSVREKERKALEDQRTNLAAAQRRQQMIAGLPHLFNMTRSIYQSQGRSVMLHKDLLEKIASSSAEITDQGEIEERLKLLLELAPDWITTKASLTGEIMYRVQKNAEFAAIWRRLSSAVNL